MVLLLYLILKNVQSIDMIKQNFVIEFLRMLNTNQISTIGFLCSFMGHPELSFIVKNHVCSCLF